MVSASVVVCFAVLAVVAATDVQQCPGKNIADLSNNVQLIPCKKIPCKLKKGSNQAVQIAFTPKKELNEAITHVTGEIAGIELPFVGVDGQSICNKVFNEDGSAASCPLKAGTKYLYKDSFPILSFYPSVDVKVRWELMHQNDPFVCFTVRTKIAS